MKEKLTAAVVGGGAGGKWNMNGLRDSQEFELVAAADMNPEVCKKLEAEFPGIRTFTSHGENLRSHPDHNGRC